MPDRVRLMPLVHDPENDQPVVTVQHPQKLEVMDEDEGEEFAEDEGAPPAAGTEAEGTPPDGGGEE